MKPSRPRRPPPRRFTVQHGGYTMWLVTFLSEHAYRAARPLFGDDAIWLGRSLVVDQRYVVDVVDGLTTRDGFQLVST